MTRHCVDQGRARSKTYSDEPHRAVNSSSSEQGQDTKECRDKNAAFIGN